LEERRRYTLMLLRERLHARRPLFLLQLFDFERLADRAADTGAAAGGEVHVQAAVCLFDQLTHGLGHTPIHGEEPGRGTVVHLEGVGHVKQSSAYKNLAGCNPPFPAETAE